MRITLIIAASAGLAAAQLNYNSTTGKFTCAQPNQAYCASDSLKTNIIVRCNNDAVGQPGNCNDNLDGEPPIGNAYGLHAYLHSFLILCDVHSYYVDAQHDKLVLFSFSLVYVRPHNWASERDRDHHRRDGYHDPSTAPTSAVTATTLVPPPAPPSSSGGASGPGSPPPGTSGPGPVVTLTSTSSVAAVSSTSFPTAGAVSNHVGVGLGIMGLFVGAML
ncbi:hypothetical protein J7T55_009372 [Diaporthe amygdali]|uniref:uncharacterized protein n=1 Tax=Phomopsis amygdali TaxID=1214568 RepID=UPI0022FE68AF|nr:uncharacterized protein J7T55_009372 [Diaporthe amygdali]KAJ0107407.1 hypothetical protein J7T55_009372 [Diaporthe amygdali]